MVNKTNTKKKYTPNSKEKYMCAKHKKFFTEELLNWKPQIQFHDGLRMYLDWLEKI